MIRFPLHYESPKPEPWSKVIAGFAALIFTLVVIVVALYA
jgi:hypothetical protein